MCAPVYLRLKRATALAGCADVALACRLWQGGGWDAVSNSIQTYNLVLLQYNEINRAWDQFQQKHVLWPRTTRLSGRLRFPIGLTAAVGPEAVGPVNMNVCDSFKMTWLLLCDQGVWLVSITFSPWVKCLPTSVLLRHHACFHSSNWKYYAELILDDNADTNQ